jgi:hypothetical protein
MQIMLDIRSIFFLCSLLPSSLSNHQQQQDDVDRDAVELLFALVVEIKLK